MRIGLICANDDELAPFLEEMEVTGTHEHAMLKFYEGKLCGKNVVALYSGVCKVNAAIATQVLIDHFEVDGVINAGVAGGMDPKVKILDTVVSTEIGYHDVADGILVEFHPWMKTKFFQADPQMLASAQKALASYPSKGSIHFGRMVTGEAFIDQEGRAQINETYHPLSVDMETGAMAHACYVNNIPFLAVRSITDADEETGDDAFNANLEEAVRIAKDVTLQVLRELV